MKIELKNPKHTEKLSFGTLEFEQKWNSEFIHWKLNDGKLVEVDAFNFIGDNVELNRDFPQFRDLTDKQFKELEKKYNKCLKALFSPENVVRAEAYTNRDLNWNPCYIPSQEGTTYILPSFSQPQLEDRRDWVIKKFHKNYKGELKKMTEIQPPVTITHDYVVELMKGSNPETMNYHHFHTSSEALEFYNKMREKEYLVVMAMYSTIERDDGTSDFKKWIIAKNM